VTNFVTTQTVDDVDKASFAWKQQNVSLGLRFTLAERVIIPINLQIAQQIFRCLEQRVVLDGLFIEIMY